MVIQNDIIDIWIYQYIETIFNIYVFIYHHTVIPLYNCFFHYCFQFSGTIFLEYARSIIHSSKRVLLKLNTFSTSHIFLHTCLNVWSCLIDRNAWQILYKNGNVKMNNSYFVFQLISWKRFDEMDRKDQARDQLNIEHVADNNSRF